MLIFPRLTCVERGESRAAVTLGFDIGAQIGDLSAVDATNLMKTTPFFFCIAGLVCLATLRAQRFEAEDASLTGLAVSSAASGFSGSGYVNGFTDGSQRVSFTFEAEAGIHKLAIGYRTPSGEKGFGGALNGVGFSGMFEASSSWDRFELGTVLLKEGENALWIGGGWNYYEIDYIELTKAEAPAPPKPVDPSLVDPLASEEAKALIAYLSNNYGIVTLSGQQDVAELDVVEDLTGVRPAIVGGDLIEYSPSRIEFGSDPDNHTESLIAQHEAGMIVTVSWHWNAPTDLVNSGDNLWWRGFYTSGTTFDFEAALDDPEGDNYALILRDIDAIAAQLKKLSDANVPVLWRPLHESDGGWFWWGTKGADNLRRLWILLYERLTVHHGLHNLIWVQTIDDLSWYAGDEYVDILGVDAYPDDSNDPLSGTWARFLERFDGEKIIALSEFGRVPDVPTMHQLGVWWSYFMSWSGELGAGGMEDVDKLRTIYQSTHVVTFDELNAPDADADGLDSVQEAALGSSDDDPDSNDDGVEDGLSVKIGYSPLEDLSGLRAFFAASEKHLAWRDEDGEVLAMTKIEFESTEQSLGAERFQLFESADLQQWSTVLLDAHDFVDEGDGAASVRVSFGAGGAFLSCAGVAF